MEQFPHLNLTQKFFGKPRYTSGGVPDRTTIYNKLNRREHSQALANSTLTIQENWLSDFAQRDGFDLATLNPDIVPVFLKINPKLITSDFYLDQFGIEIISEEEDGYIIGASLDNFSSLTEKINGFISSDRKTGLIADFWEIENGNREDWKPKHILSEALFSQWSFIKDSDIFKIEVGIAFSKPIGKVPDRLKQGGEKRFQKYCKKVEERDNALMVRETNFEQFIRSYGQVISPLVYLEDSFACEVEINGKGLKDLVCNYPFVFEVSEIETIEVADEPSDEASFSELSLMHPNKGATIVGVIDSGIMEGHKFIAPAIDSATSKSYLDTHLSTADYVKGGGHGTRVSGAILYPNGISNLPSPYQLPCFIRNLRVLNSNNSLESNFPAQLMQKIVDENEDCKIFNLSINSQSSFRLKHMSSWATSIDSLIHERQVLFVISAGNILREVIQKYLIGGTKYPDFLKLPFCRLANPAQSSFAITVGSINQAEYHDTERISLGKVNEISAFSRIGSGIWGQVKPDVVEYGGGLLVSKNDLVLISVDKETSPELLRSTLDGGGAYSKDSVGTSFSAPKVSNILAQLKNLYPNENVNLLRALLVQGARLPNDHFINPTTASIKFFGYGLPSIERVIKNTEQRITFYNTGLLKVDEANIYTILIPDQILSQANEFDVLIEVTLAYTAKVRRTRQKTKSYLSTWLDWTSSKFDESFEAFRNRSIVEQDLNDNTTDDDSDDVIKWKIRERGNWGEVRDINRNNSTLQKDWTILKAYNLSKEMSFAVRAHKGWDRNSEPIPYAFTVSIEALGSNISIYELIRIENEIENEIETEVQIRV